MLCKLCAQCLDFILLCTLYGHLYTFIWLAKTHFSENWWLNFYTLRPQICYDHTRPGYQLRLGLSTQNKSTRHFCLQKMAGWYFSQPTHCQQPTHHPQIHSTHRQQRLFHFNRIQSARCTHLDQHWIPNGPQPQRTREPHWMPQHYSLHAVTRCMLLRSPHLVLASGRKHCSQQIIKWTARNASKMAKHHSFTLWTKSKPMSHNSVFSLTFTHIFQTPPHKKQTNR